MGCRPRARSVLQCHGVLPSAPHAEMPFHIGDTATHSSGTTAPQNMPNLENVNLSALPHTSPKPPKTAYHLGKTHFFSPSRWLHFLLRPDGWSEPVAHHPPSVATHLRQPHAATSRRAACARSSCLGRVCSVTSCITPHTLPHSWSPTYKLRQGRAPMLSPNTEHMDTLCASNCTTRHGYVQKSDDDRTADGDIAGSSTPAKHLALLPKAPVSFEPRCAPFCNMSVLCSENVA